LISLKQSKCASADNGYLKSWFGDTEFLATSKLELLNHTTPATAPGSIPERKFNVGDVVTVKVKSQETYGTLFAHKGSKFSGFATLEHSKNNELKPGQEVTAVILDIDDSKKLMDLSLKASLIKTRQQAATGVPAVATLLQKKKVFRADIELVKESYLVVSIPSHESVIGFVSCKVSSALLSLRFFFKSLTFAMALFFPWSQDYNHSEGPFEHFSNQTQVTVSLDVTESPTESSRLLFTMRDSLIPERAAVVSLADFPVGKLVNCKISALKETQLLVTAEGSIRGRVQASEILDDDAPFVADLNGKGPSPFANFHVGDEVVGRVIGIHEIKTNGTKVLDITLKPVVVAAAVMPKALKLSQILKNERCYGYIQNVSFPLPFLPAISSSPSSSWILSCLFSFSSSFFFFSLVL